VLTEYPLRKILQKPDLSIVNWAIELGQFDIEFHPRTSIKGQALADFLVEFCNIPESEELPKESTWVVYVDGSSTGKRSGVGVMLLNLEGQELRFAVKLSFVPTNSEAVIASLSIAREVGAKNIEIRSDSQVVVGQAQVLVVTTHFFFLENIQTDLHSGTTTCRSANIWHMPHNMHLIIRVTPNSGI
jgi:hypothetical protein